MRTTWNMRCADSRDTPGQGWQSVRWRSHWNVWRGRLFGGVANRGDRSQRHGSPPDGQAHDRASRRV